MLPPFDDDDDDDDEEEEEEEEARNATDREDASSAFSFGRSRDRRPQQQQQQQQQPSLRRLGPVDVPRPLLGQARPRTTWRRSLGLLAAKECGGAPVSRRALVLACAPTLGSHQPPVLIMKELFKGRALVGACTVVGNTHPRRGPLEVGPERDAGASAARPRLVRMPRHALQDCANGQLDPHRRAHH
jgi:hypothetical protein